MPLALYKVRLRGQTDFEVFEGWSPYDAAEDFCRYSVNPDGKAPCVTYVEVVWDGDGEDSWEPFEVYFEPNYRAKRVYWSEDV